MPAHFQKRHLLFYFVFLSVSSFLSTPDILGKLLNNNIDDDIINSN